MESNLPKINGLTEGLADIRRAIEDLHLSTLAYAAVGMTADRYIISVVDGDDAIIINRRHRTDDPDEEILGLIGKLAVDHNIKIIAAVILSVREERELGSRLWLEEDIVPFFEVAEQVSEQAVRDAALRYGSKFDEHGLISVPVDEKDLQVEAAKLVTASEYEKLVSNKSWQMLLDLGEKFASRGKPLVFINATAQGGGVALMRHALMRLYEEIGVPARWHVMIPNSDVFEITKSKFHNVLQGVAKEDTVLTEADKQVYLSWIHDNSVMLNDVLRETDCIVIDDPQPAGLIPIIRDINPAAKIIYRSHIHLDREWLAVEGSPQEQTWQFLWRFIKEADSFVAHPVERFIPREAAKMAVTMPATTDPLDGLNKPLSDTQMAYYRKLFNKILLEHAQEPLDDERPYLIQVARFDPSKGIPDVIESYRLLREKMGDERQIPQLVLVGHGSVDDPDGVPVYNMTLQLLMKDEYRRLAPDVKVVRLHHNDQILNALLRGSHAALQLSHREGYEIKVSEALHKGKPVIAFRAGGIPLQIEDGKTGYLVDIGDCETVAEKLLETFIDADKYQQMCREAENNVNERHFTTANATKWLYLSVSILAGELEKMNSVSVEEKLNNKYK